MLKKTKTAPIKEKNCIVCGDTRWNEKSNYCKDCSKIYRHMRNKGYPPEAVKGIWDYIRKYGKLCYYMGMKFDLDNPKSPRYLVFDHWIPNDPRKIVPCAAFINTMKAEFLEAEFKDAFCQLADHFRLGKPVDIKDPVHWYRVFIRQRSDPMSAPAQHKTGYAITISVKMSQKVAALLSMGSIIFSCLKL